MSERTTLISGSVVHGDARTGTCSGSGCGTTIEPISRQAPDSETPQSDESFYEAISKLPSTHPQRRNLSTQQIAILRAWWSEGLPSTKQSGLLGWLKSTKAAQVLRKLCKGE